MTRREKRDWDARDEQVKQDFPIGGRGATLLAELDQEIENGAIEPLEEGLAQRRNARL